MTQISPTRTIDITIHATYTGPFERDALIFLALDLLQDAYDNADASWSDTDSPPGTPVGAIEELSLEFRGS